MENALVCECKADDRLYLNDGDVAKGVDNESTITVAVTDSIDFGKVAVGKKAWNAFKIKNTTGKTQEYFVYYDPNTNPIYRTFDFTWTKTVRPGESFECKIVYKPLFSFDVNVDYLFIQETSGELLTLSLRGESIGPRVELSTNYATFYAHKKKRTVERIIEISNAGESDVLYHFDIAYSRIGMFALNKCRGTIPPRKCDFVKITFNAPKQLGVYSERLPLLILHHKPRIIHLLGFNTIEEVAENEVMLKHYNFDISEKSGYGGYLYDAMTTMTNPPPISLSVNYLNFEGVIVDGTEENSKTLVTSLTNHMSERIEVEWYHQNASSPFSISPISSKIHAYDSRLFECKFCPSHQDQFYHDILSAGVYWIDTRKRSSDSDVYVTVPIPIQLRILGHSFPTNKKWIPQLIVPDTIVLPPCFANSSCCTTFVLKVEGYLPVSYRFLPPKKSQFIVKPMMGVVDDYQIVVVYFRCGDENMKAFVERWGIELNGTGVDYRSIYIKTYCERPTVRIGVDNTVTFPIVQPQCQEFQTVQIYNTCVHGVKYKFQLTDEHSLLHIDYPEGTLPSNDAINLNWTITGKMFSTAAYTVTCEIRALEQDATSGTPFEIPVAVFAECSHSQLCSTPTRCNFRKLEVGTEHTFRFNLYNFGQSTVHYKLIFWDRKKPDFNEQCMTVIPSQGSIKPKDRNEVLLYLHCKYSGNFDIHVYYQTRLNKDSARIINGDQIHEVFSFKFSSSYPCIQIVDIIDHNFGPLFSKSILWDLFTIDKINNHLKSMKQDETRNLSIFVPESEFSSETFQSTWVLKNTSDFDTKMNLRRIKLCDCPLVQTTNGLTIRSLVYDCKHRDIFAMILSGDVFQANAYQTINITVRYHDKGITHLCYVIEFSHSRSLKCNIFINTLSEDVQWPSKYLTNFHMDMGCISVDDDQSPIQAFWLYNNTSNTVSYEMLVDSADRRPYKKDFEILRCLNPEGRLMPFCSYPILFRFRPLQYKLYNFVLPLRLGEHSYQFYVTGTGTSRYREMRHTLHLEDNLQINPLDDVFFSEEHIAFRSILVWTKCESVLFVRNLSKQRLIGYSFERVFVEGIVEVKVLRGKGVLRPRECHMLVVQVTAFDQPCSMTVQLPCKLLDHYAYYKHKQSTIVYDLTQRDLKEQFIITEKGVEYPPNEVVIEPMPKNFYKTLSLDIDIVSVSWTDEVLGEENHFFQFPQYILNLDYSRITKTLRPKHMERPIGNIHSIENRMKGAGDGSICEEKTPKTIENVDLIKDVIDCTIMNVLESDVFWKVLGERHNLPPPYYIQFKAEDSIKYKEEVREKERFLERSLKSMQPPLICEVLQQIITESIHEVFQLGSQVKSQMDLQYLYEPQFKCPHTCTNIRCKNNFQN